MDPDLLPDQRQVFVSGYRGFLGDVSPVAVFDRVTHSDQRPIFPHKKRPRLPEPLFRTADTLQNRFMLFKPCVLFSYTAFGRLVRRATNPFWWR